MSTASPTAASPTPIGIVLVDDQAVVRAGLRLLIESQPEMRVVGEAGSGADAVALVAAQQPEIILIVLDVGGPSRLDFIAELLLVAPRSRVVILTGVRDSEAHRQAVRLGAMGLVMKDVAAEVLLKAIAKVHAGEMWIDGSMMWQVLGDVRRANGPKEVNAEFAKIATLTKREREVLALGAEGLRNREMADRLFISETTVRHHLTSIFGKLGVSNRLELLVYAYRNHLIKPPG